MLNKPVKYSSGGAILFQAVLLFAVSTTAFCANAQSRLFFDDFDGPALNPNWVTNGLPTSLNPDSYPFDVFYVGSPQVAFQNIEGASSLRISTAQGALRRVGWTMVGVFTNSSFRYEIRFNTLVQSLATSIDGCIEIWLLDAANSNRCDVAGLFGSWYSTSPRFMTSSSIDQTYFVPDFAYQNNTWYRLILEGSTNANIRAALCSDDGKELMNQEFTHDLRAFPTGFKIGLSQGMGTPDNIYPQNIAIDYAAVSAFSGSQAVLSADQVSGGLLLNWPVLLPFVLERAPSLSPPVQWMAVTNPVTVLNGFNSVFVTDGNQSGFFRLRYQVP
jgi:hypothetical protein